MLIENRNEPIVDEHDDTLTKDRLFDIASALVCHLFESVGDGEETVQILEHCIGLSQTEIERLSEDWLD